MGVNAREAILAAAKREAQARGYGGLNFRDLAREVGIKAASIHYHFPSKADLGAAVARRYWQDTAEALEKLAETAGGPMEGLRQYPETFRRALGDSNRMCLSSFMAAEHGDLPDAVRAEVQAFADVNVAWLSKLLSAAELVASEECDARARAIYAAVAGAQLVARSRSNVSVYDALIASYRSVGLLPA